ncbi:hypothetical protein HY346_00845 [Candidatus Microgenomates bacterium]|nr:hypothetical protein [Candidatus Microgenomates bacterium]
MSTTATDIVIRKGSTFSKVIRWAAEPLIYKPITGITKAAPPVITATGHGVPNGWRVAVASVIGMRDINGKSLTKGGVPFDSEFHKATVLTANTLSLNDVNALDFTAYTSGGTLVYFTPVDLNGYTARMQIRLTEVAADPALVSLTTENGGIAIDNTAKTITLTIAATATDDLTFLAGVYDLELISSTGVVTPLLKGNVTVEAEVTR